MLPHFVWADLLDVLADLTQAGYALDAAWFEAQHEFRFPLLRRDRARAASRSSCARRSSPGTCSARTGSAGGTARYVDSSVERLQVKVTGLDAVASHRALQRPARAADANRHCGRGGRQAFASRRGKPASGMHPTLRRARAA